LSCIGCFFQAEYGIRDCHVTGVQTCALPIFPGALGRTDDFRHPIHARPEGIGDGPWFSRAEIVAADRLAGLELVWLSSAVEAFLAQVQGSVRVRLADGTVRRFGFAGKNGHPYRSVGAELVR